MSSEKVIALSMQALDCGKRVSDTKRKFIWKFEIASVQYTLQLIASALSGKRVITLNQEEIYCEKDLFNINFDFNRNIEGHSIRLQKTQETMNTYKLRIDNREFDYLLKKKRNMEMEGKKPEMQKRSSKYEKTENDDPFSEFSSLAAQQPSNESKENDPFGSFDDFDNFDFKKAENKPSVKLIQEPVQESPKEENQEEAIFNTNSLKNIADSLNNEDLMNDFTTNAYSINNNYLDLVNSREAQSEQFGVFDPSEKKTTLDKMKLDMTGKQMMNRTKATAGELKGKAADFFESLL